MRLVSGRDRGGVLARRVRGSSTSTSTFTSTASYQTLVGAGIKLLGVGNTTAAGQLFQQAIAKNPSDPLAHYDLGVVYQGAGNRRGAMREYNQALRADSRYVPALYNAAVLLSPHNAPLSIFYYREVTTIQPHSPTAFLNLGLLEDQTPALRKQAVRDLTRAVQLDPTLRGRIPSSLRTAVRTPAKSATHG